MKIVGVIAEFNPFHEGHAYFLQQVRSRSGADYIAAVMSGDFVQRGEPAVQNKYIRTETALRGGADLVLELPVSCSTAGAPDFAFGAVSILDSLGCIDELWFGSECGEVPPLLAAASALYPESEDFSAVLQTALKQGLSFPSARSIALETVLKAQGLSSEEITGCLREPNNLLGIEYCIALKKLGSSIKPCTLPRIGEGYNSTDSNAPFCSALAIRKALAEENDRSALFPDDFSLLLRCKLLRETVDSLCEYKDISSELARRIKEKENLFASFTQFISILKTKNLTWTHISRCLMHILLNLKKEDAPFASYIRLLGFKDCPELLHTIKKRASVPLCPKPSSLENNAYEAELFASSLYESVYAWKTQTPFVHEFTRSVVRI